MNFINIYLKENKLNNFLLIISSIVITALSYIISQRFKDIFNVVELKSNLKVYIFSMIVLYILVFAMSMLSNLFQNKSLYQANRNFRIFSLHKLLKADYSYLVENSVGEISSQISMASTNVATFFNSIILIIATLIQFVVVSFIIYNTNKYAFLMTLIFLPVVYFSTAGIKKFLTRYQERFRKYNNELYGEALEVLELCKNVKAKNREEFFYNKIEDKITKTNNSIVAYSIFESYSSNIVAFIVSLAPIMVMFILINFKFISTINNGEIMILYVFIPYILISFSNLYSCFLQYYSMKPYIKELNKYKNISEEGTGEFKVNSFENIETKAVKVNLTNGRTLIIPDMTIKKGDKVIIKGESGIGKSTFIKILLGLKRDYEGSVFLNNHNIKELELESVRKLIGVSFQEGGVYSMSVEDNIMLNTDKDITNLIKIVELEKLVSDKKSNIISSKTISGGEKSRITIAQNLAQEPQVLLIDESIASINEEMEGRIISNIIREYKDCTIICISHRTSTQKYFDKIINFNLEV